MVTEVGAYTWTALEGKKKIAVEINRPNLGFNIDLTIKEAKTLIEEIKQAIKESK